MFGLWAAAEQGEGISGGFTSWWLRLGLYFCSGDISVAILLCFLLVFPLPGARLGLLGSQPCSIPPQEVIRSILVSGRIGPDIKLAECYGLRLKHVKSDEIHWLHPDLTVGEVQEKYECLHLEAEWR